MTFMEPPGIPIPGIKNHRENGEVPPRRAVRRVGEKRCPELAAQKWGRDRQASDQSRWNRPVTRQLRGYDVWQAGHQNMGGREGEISGDLTRRRFGQDETTRDSAFVVLRGWLPEIPVKWLDPACEGRPVMVAGQKFCPERRIRHSGLTNRR